MSLRIEGKAAFATNRQPCSGCFELVQSVNVSCGAPVMVGPKTETHRRTGLGNSSFFGRVIVSMDYAYGIGDGRGRTHLMLKISTQELGVDGSVKKVKSFYTTAHDLKPLP